MVRIHSLCGVSIPCNLYIVYLSVSTRMTLFSSPLTLTTYGWIGEPCWCSLAVVVAKTCMNIGRKYSDEECYVLSYCSRIQVID
ncbi:hypothetical protein DFJ43DRAFT_1058631 [Lentinula guzmanii]|uniref:Uncharacterized protein n=1 Tax=Lentinula guzmanii TaxID=2804957 RepID=A0AA38JQF0_9AGAR|nr:hypothetical protein DFJ43DRAFT_1058631 [Lentinula guzmanii]